MNSASASAPTTGTIVLCSGKALPARSGMNPESHCLPCRICSLRAIRGASSSPSCNIDSPATMPTVTVYGRGYCVVLQPVRTWRSSGTVPGQRIAKRLEVDKVAIILWLGPGELHVCPVPVERYDANAGMPPLGGRCGSSTTGRSMNNLAGSPMLGGNSYNVWSSRLNQRRSHHLQQNPSFQRALWPIWLIASLSGSSSSLSLLVQEGDKGRIRC